MAITFSEAKAIMAQSEEIIPPEAIVRAYDEMAEAITQQLSERDLLIFVVLNGALIPAGHLLTRLSFPFTLGYLHASRFQGALEGGQEVTWRVAPSLPVAGRTVLVVEDIFDEGHTFKSIVTRLKEEGAAAVYSAALVNKVHNRKVPNFNVDFVGLDVPDRYIFGCGMDYNEYWRNLPGIWAVKESKE